MFESDLSSISGGVAAGGELDSAARLALHLKLHQTKVVACRSKFTSKSMLKEENFSIQSNIEQLKMLSTHLFQRHLGLVFQCQSKRGAP